MHRRAVGVNPRRAGLRHDPFRIMPRRFLRGKLRANGVPDFFTSLLMTTDFVVDAHFPRVCESAGPRGLAPSRWECADVLTESIVGDCNVLGELVSCRVIFVGRSVGFSFFFFTRLWDTEMKNSRRSSTWAASLGKYVTYSLLLWADRRDPMQDYACIMKSGRLSRVGMRLWELRHHIDSFLLSDLNDTLSQVGAPRFVRFIEDSNSVIFQVSGFVAVICFRIMKNSPCRHRVGILFLVLTC